MKPTQAELQVLVACRAILSDPSRVLTCEDIEAGVRGMHGDRALDAAAAIDSLAARGWLTTADADGTLGISFEARAVADAASPDLSPEYFGEWMTRCEHSPTFARYCHAVYGTPLVQFNMVDHEQMERLLTLLDLAPGRRLLDLGCGVGTQAEYVSDRTGAHVTGVDFAPAAIRRASERTATKRDRLEFIVGDLNRLDLPAACFDAAVAFDTLYFVSDLDKTVGDVLRLLAPGGRLFAFYSLYRKAVAPPDVLEPEGTPLGAVLTRRGVRYEAIDFSANDRALWERQRRAIEELRTDFEAEGNVGLYWDRFLETDGILEVLATGFGRRYLYVASAP